MNEFQVIYIDRENDYQLFLVIKCNIAAYCCILIMAVVTSCIPRRWIQ
jgi:hypothetical protein